MPWKGNDFQHTLAEAVSAETYDKYGPEHDDAVQDRANVANGARADIAAKLRRFVLVHGVTLSGHVVFDAELLADLVDPYSGKDGDNGEFARYTLQGPEGSKMIIPSDY